MSNPLSPRAALVFTALALLPLTPWMSKYYLLLAFDALLFGAVAMSLDLLIGYTGLVSFGHAAYFGIGAYTTGILMKKLGMPFLLAFPAAGLLAAALAAVFGFFCVRLTKSAYRPTSSTARPRLSQSEVTPRSRRIAAE